MENVAHALAGLLVARGAVALRERRDRVAPGARFATHAAWVSAIAGNVPDGDMVLTPVTGGKLGYLLHHRGHTHTLLVGLLLGLAVAFVSIAVWRRRGGEAPTAGDRRWLLALGALGPVVHLAMDGWNTYGIHPLWPVVDRWMYGDAVFIVEPLLWLAAVPFLFRDATSRAGRWLLGALGVLGVVLPWVVGGFVPIPIRVALVAFAAAAAALAWRLPAGRRAATGLALFFAVPLVFLGTSTAAKGAVARATAAAFPHETVVDVASTAWPSNPLCWSTIAMTTSPEGDLVLRRAAVALVPGVLPLAACPEGRESATATLAPVAARGDDVVRWEGESRTALERLRTLARRCDVAAAMRFIRAPYVVEREGALVLGDLRFDRDARLDFADLELPSEVGACPRFVPSWEPPRADELRGAGAAPRE